MENWFKNHPWIAATLVVLGWLAGGLAIEYGEPVLGSWLLVGVGWGLHWAASTDFSTTTDEGDTK